MAGFFHAIINEQTHIRVIAGACLGVTFYASIVALEIIQSYWLPYVAISRGADGGKHAGHWWVGAGLLDYLPVDYTCLDNQSTRQNSYDYSPAYSDYSDYSA